MDNKLSYNHNDDKQNSPPGDKKLMLEKFGHWNFKPTNHDLIKVPNEWGSKLVKLWVPV